MERHVGNALHHSVPAICKELIQRLKSRCSFQKHVRETHDLGYTSGSNALDIQVLHIQRVLFDKLPAALDILTHQRGEDLFGRGDILKPNLQ